MNRALIKTNCDITSNIEADTLIADGDIIYAYKSTETDGKLIGLYRLDNVQMAYLSGSDKG